MHSQHPIPLIALALQVTACTGVVGGAGIEITDELAASRTGGVAPLAVFFSGPGNDFGTRAFHERGYVWDFDDPSSGTWSATGRSKNTARGPLAAHVFETPGTYSVRVIVTDVDNSSHVRGVTITVEDPEVVFADNTVCFSTGSDFTDCPSNNHVTLAAFDEAMEYAAQGMRLLLKRGDTFSGASQATLDAPGPGIVGAFGSGDPPAINMNYGSDGLLLLSDGSPTIDDWRLMDLHFIGNGSGFAIESENHIRRVTMLRLSSSNADEGLVISTSKPDHYGMPVHSELALVECSFHDMVGGYGAFISSEKLMVLGNRVVDVDGHVFRTQHVKQGVYDNNYLARPHASAGTVLKLHAEPVGGERDGLSRPSSHYVITGNVFVGAGNSWNVSLGPQSARWNESVHNGILDGNHFVSATGGDERGNQVQLHLAGTDTTVRNNVFDISDAQEHIAIHVERRGIEPAPNHNRIYNNTCFTSSGGTATCVMVSSSASNTQVHNNLLVAPSASSRRPLDNDGSATDAGANAALGVNTFMSSSPADALDFALSETNSAIDAGLATGRCQIDFRGTSRNTDGNGDGTASPDIGAFEHPGPG